MKLHLGCGKRYLPGFVHVDVSYDCGPHIDYCQSITDLTNFESESVELIYASHVFEYFPKEQVPDVLDEWRRVLQKEGVLRLAVPDFAALCDVYKMTGKLDYILGPLYGHWTTGEVKMQHATCYDIATLTNVLVDAGFYTIRGWDWRTVFADMDYDDYSQAYVPHMDKDSGIHISLNLEAVK